MLSFIRAKLFIVIVPTDNILSPNDYFYMQRTPSPLLLAAITALLALYLASLWVPIWVDDFDVYRTTSLLQGIRPRAFLGTITSIFNIGPWGFTFLKIAALYIWLLLILEKIATKLFDKNGYSKWQLFVFIVLSFIFTFNTVTYMTYAQVGIIDSIPYLLILIAVMLLDKVDERSPSLVQICVINLLLISAVLIHEKSIFDIAILFIWVFFRSGYKAAIFYISPSILISLEFLYLVRGQKTSGFTPEEYIQIFGWARKFLMEYSLNIYGIIIGGGSLWVLYGVFSYQYIRRVLIGRLQKFSAFLMVFLMLVICFLPLTVAWDTNRIIGLIWLPTFLLLTKIDLNSLFTKSRSTFIGLIFLCIFQIAMPPVLIPHIGVVPFNGYGQFARDFLESSLFHSKK